MIARENEVVVGIVAHELPPGLPDGVGGALIPVRFSGLLGREDLHEAVAEEVHPEVWAMWRLSDAELNCVSTKIRRMSA